MIDNGIDVGAETFEIDRREMSGRSYEFGRRYERSTPYRCETADRHTVASDGERVATVQRAHDLCIVVSQLALRNHPVHSINVARALRLSQPKLRALRCSL